MNGVAGREAELMDGVAAVRSAMLTGLGVTALALAGAAPARLSARPGNQAPGTAREAGQAPGMVGQTGQAPGMVGEAGQAPGMVGETGQAPGMVGETGQGPGAVGAASQGPGTVGAASQGPGMVGAASQAPETAMGEEVDGGRDPFARPAASGSRRPVEVRPSGLSGVAVDEVVLRGVVTTRNGRLAVLEGPDGRAWVARRGERLHDGAVQGITADEVLFLRDAAESAAARVVGKRLRDGESAR